MKHFDVTATRDALPFERLIPALRQLFVQGCEVPQRHVHRIGDLTSLVMPAWQAGRYYGVKIVNIAPGNAALGLPGLHGSYLLFDANTGVPLASIDGSEITARRTAAASALAASYLAPAAARRLLVVGAGRVGSLLPEAYRTVLPQLEAVEVWTRARPVAALEAAVRAADIVSCATLSRAPLVLGQWLRETSHLDLIGSFTPEMRETDAACFAGAELWLDNPEALLKSGDLLEAGVQACAGTLADLCRGARRSGGGGQRTVFKSVGTALEDLAAAILVYEFSPA